MISRRSNLSRPVEHFGYRDRISVVQIEGTGHRAGRRGAARASKPGEFILGYPDDVGVVPPLPQPEVLSRNGSVPRLPQAAAACRRLFRDFLRQNAATPDEQELLAAKLMGRWRSGAPLVLAPERDDPVLGQDPLRNNDFTYGQTDPCRPMPAPRGVAHPAGQSSRHRAQRPAAPDGPPRVDLWATAARGRRRGWRGARTDACSPGCARINDQFEFVQQTWINDGEFHGARRTSVIRSPAPMMAPST